VRGPGLAKLVAAGVIDAPARMLMEEFFSTSGTVVTSVSLVAAAGRTHQAHITVRVPGTYTWDACRGWNARLGHYQIRSTLRGHGFSHTIKNTFQRDPNDLGPSHVYGNGNYEWGGRIARYQPGVTEPAR
jgi:hypothetical protein